MNKYWNDQRIETICDHPRLDRQCVSMRMLMNKQLIALLPSNSHFISFNTFLSQYCKRKIWANIHWNLEKIVRWKLLIASCWENANYLTDVFVFDNKKGHTIKFFIVQNMMKVYTCTYPQVFVQCVWAKL